MARKKPNRRKPRTSKPYKPVWKGPDTSGVTHSSLGVWAESPELFGIAYLDGYRPRTISLEVEYGNVHHLLDETYCLALADKKSPDKALQLANAKVDEYAVLKQRGSRPESRQAFAILIEQVKAIYPVYLDYYREQKIEWIGREMLFRVPLEVAPARPNHDAWSSLLKPSLVHLTGKRDGLYHAVDNGRRGVGLWEVKTKGRIDRAHLADQLRCDSQSLFYLFATQQELDLQGGGQKVVQETYDVLKRPGLKQARNETDRAYVSRCRDHVIASPIDYFHRVVIPVQPHELNNYYQNFLLPELRSFLAWWRSVENDPSPQGRKLSPLHYLTLSALIKPYGKSEYYTALVENQSSHTLRRIEDPFPELHDELQRLQIETAEDACPAAEKLSAKTSNKLLRTLSSLAK